MTFASPLSFATSVATSGTITPAWRAGGSVTLIVLRREVTSTPRSSALTVSIVFFFAFRFQQLGNGERLQFHICLNQYGAIGTNGHRRNQYLLALRHATGYGNHFCRIARF